MTRPDEPLAKLLEAARGGSPRAVARLISLVEDTSPRLRELMELLSAHGSDRSSGGAGAQVIGLTGAPGVGKSTTTGALVSAYRRRGQRVGVLAIDPSSPFSGGALLGDRIRMQEHATDPGVFIRSMATRGQLGGLSWATPQALRVLEACGFDVILIETVGVGQAEVEIASLADSIVVLLAPGMGDAIQAAKAGILEVADVFVVNKADRDGADQTVRELKGMLALGFSDSAGSSSTVSWNPPVCKTVASRAEGIDEVVAALAHHREWAAASGAAEHRRTARARGEIEAIALTRLRARMDELRGQANLGQLAAGVATGQLDPYAAADQLIAGVTKD